MRFRAFPELSVMLEKGTESIKYLLRPTTLYDIISRCYRKNGSSDHRGFWFDCSSCMECSHSNHFHGDFWNTEQHSGNAGVCGFRNDPCSCVYHLDRVCLEQDEGKSRKTSVPEERPQRVNHVLFF